MDGVRRFLLSGAFGHVGATLFVAVLIASGITRGWVSPAVGSFTDVGVSYRLAAAAGVLTIRVPGRWRSRYVVALLAVLAGGLLLSRTFTDVGHATAFGIGAGLAVLVSAATGRSPPA